jgi:uncharacterized membrane protein YbaN (DUF454 family)
MKPIQPLDNPKRPDDSNLNVDDNSVHPATWFWKRCAFLLAGLICVALAAAGAILPVLPCTPFLLLAAYCFARSSTRMHRWLLHSRFFGPIIQDWQTHRAIRRRVRTSSVLIVLLAVGLTFAVVRPSLLAGTLIILLVGVGLVVIFRLNVRD